MHLGKWGAVCDDEWDAREGQVVCRQLGFNGTSRVTHSSHFGQTASNKDIYLNKHTNNNMIVIKPKLITSSLNNI